MTHLRTSTVTTRKQHKCEGCLLWYPKGTVMTTTAHIVDGEFVASRRCPTCDAVLEASPEECWEDGYYPGDIRDDPDWETTRARIGAPMGTKEGGAK